jgi:hypothetical protein
MAAEATAFVHPGRHIMAAVGAVYERPDEAPALEDARARELMVVPYCPFIAGFIQRHLDEYRELVAPEMLSGERL